MSDVVLDRSIDPITGRPWAQWQDTEGSSRYLKLFHGIPIEPKTLANRRATGRPGPAWLYFGQKPLATLTELDRFAQEDALSDESPLTRGARARRAVPTPA